MLMKTVDGKEVRSSSYPMDEFKKLTKAQREAVKELRSQLKTQRSNNNKPSSNVNSVGLTSVDNRVRFLEQAIVAGVDNASTATNDNTRDDTSELSGSANTATGSTTEGAAGSYLRNRRSNQGNQSSSV